MVDRLQIERIDDDAGKRGEQQTHRNSACRIMQDMADKPAEPAGPGPPARRSEGGVASVLRPDGL